MTERTFSTAGKASAGYNALLTKKSGMESTVIIPCIPSCVSSLSAIPDDKKMNPRENVPTNRRIPSTEHTMPGRFCCEKKSTPRNNVPNTMMMIAWINPFVIPESPRPRIICDRCMGLAIISFMSPKFLSYIRVIPP